jgi:biopolymer transport protein ExbB/biopolymer transport protein TolQ
MEMNVAEMFGNLGLVGMVVFSYLLVLSIYSISTILDKFRRFRQSSNESAAFLLAEYGNCLREGNLKDAVMTARRHGRSHVARVVAAGFAEIFDGRTAAAPATSTVEVDRLTRALEQTSALTLAEMKRGLGGLATIGSTAPFIGLFGTVVGIIHAFEGIAASGSGGVAAVSGGIAEALVATAFGIFVAIPAVMGFNYFTATLERFQVEMNSTATQLIAYLSKQQEPAHAVR